MPIGYLISVTIVAVCTAFSVFPQPRPMLLARLSFRFGIIVNELPFLAFAWVAAATALALAQGDLDSTGGSVGLAIAVLTVVGLVVIVGREWRAGAAVDHALSAGLGADWRSSIDPGLDTQLRRRLPWVRILIGPFAMRRRDVERIANIAYGDAGAAHLLDVYRHRSAPSGAPTLIHLHGGSFKSGRKSFEARPLLSELASHGWVCISANYRLGPDVDRAEPLSDVKRVIAWVREEGVLYGADPDVLFLAGSSAGGYLALAAALTQNDPTFQPGFELADTTVTGAISLYGYYGEAVSDDQSPTAPLGLVGADAPPLFLVHGDRDTYVLVEGARLFVERMKCTPARPIVYAELPGAQHGFDLFHSIRVERVVDGIEAFSAWVRSRDRDEPGT